MKHMFIYPETKISQDQCQMLAAQLENKFPQFKKLIGQYIIPSLKLDFATDTPTPVQRFEMTMEQLEEIGLELATFLKKNKQDFSQSVSTCIIDKYILLADTLCLKESRAPIQNEKSAIEQMAQRKVMQMLDSAFDEKLENYIRQKIQTVIKRLIIEEMQKL